GHAQVEEGLADPLPAGRAEHGRGQRDPDDGGGGRGDEHRADGLPAQVGLALALQRAGPVVLLFGEPSGFGAGGHGPGAVPAGVLGGFGHDSSGTSAASESHSFSSSARVPSSRSASTAPVTQSVSGDPLSSTRPNCSSPPSSAGSCPTLSASSSSAPVM